MVCPVPHGAIPILVAFVMAPSPAESRPETPHASLQCKHRKLQRENAVIDMLGLAKRAVVDAMQQSSPSLPSRYPPTSLGKQIHPGFGDADGDTEPNTADTLATNCPTLVLDDTPTNILFCWVSRKKLRSKQWEEVQDFFEVSAVITLGKLLAEWRLGHCANKRDKIVHHFIVT